VDGVEIAAQRREGGAQPNANTGLAPPGRAAFDGRSLRLEILEQPGHPQEGQVEGFVVLHQTARSFGLMAGRSGANAVAVMCSPLPHVD
jgi:hypothetical protein